MPKRKKLSGPPLGFEKKTVKLILGITLLSFSLLLLLSFFTKAGSLLSFKESFYNIFGIGVVLVPLFGVLFSLIFFSVKSRFTKFNVAVGSLCAFLCFLGIAAILSPSFGGVLGSSLYNSLKAFITPIGAFFALFIIFLVSAVIALNSNLEEAMTMISKIYKIFAFFGRKSKQAFANSTKPNINRPIVRPNYPPGQTARPINTKSPINIPKEGQHWQYPPLSLLSDVKSTSANRGNPKHNADIIEKTFQAFNIDAKVVEFNPGPTVTEYAIKIPMGTKLSKITNLHNNLALALAAKNGEVRIQAPIPGKSLIGIEVPNISPELVSLKDALSSEVILKNKSKIAVGLGLNVRGALVDADIAKMPHVLIAGTTGSGKSVLLNTIIATILFRASPWEVKFIMADPKRVELTEYKDIPHLLTPVIIEPEKILSALRWSEKQMDQRYRQFHEAGVKNIADYNELSGFQALPYIIIVIDELYMLMQFAPVEVESSIKRLASMARATGIHLVLATQRPSVDVITGTIKANIACRIAFNVSSLVDSRVVLDQPGAEKLLGKGDMLYLPPDASKPERLQGIYASSTDIRNLISFLKQSGVAPEYMDEVTQMPVGKATGTGGEKDNLFEDAVRTVCHDGKASSSLLMRRLSIGYARSARLIDQMEMAGIVGPGEGSKPRDVLVKNPDDYFAQVNVNTQPQEQTASDQ